MLKSAATLEDRGELGLAAEPDRVKPGAGIMRFAYATGSRPLDGYTIKRGVGVGGFGEVFFAVSDAGKEVALKRIQRNLDIEIRGVTQCLNLKHPNLIAIFDIRYDDEGQAWVVMEYIRGDSLKDVLDRNPKGMPPADMLGWFRGIAAGVSYLHDHGIVHRDLKPGNLFLDESVVKIGDYGLSKYISCSRRSGQTESVGTFHYMAPEIGRGVYGKEIDVYALGIILYEMVTGRVPFDGESSHEIIMKHLTASPDVTPLPEKLRPIVQRALFKDPEKRYRSVAEMAADVEVALPGYPATHFVAAGPTTRRNPAVDAAAPYYIGPGGDTEGIYLGPLHQVASAEPIPLASAANDPEPVAAAAQQAWTNFKQWWFGPSLTTSTRILLVIVFAIVVFTNAGWVIPVAIVLGSVYLVYFGVRMIMSSMNEGTKPAAATPHATPFAPAPQAPRAPVQASQPLPIVPVAQVVTPTVPPSAATRKGQAKRRRKWHDLACEQLRRKVPAERVMELTGSMLMSSVVIAVVSFLALVATGHPVDQSVSSWTNFAWLSLTSLAGTWSVLIPAKLWEGIEGDAVRRRFLQVILGLGVGFAAFNFGQYLDPNLSHQPIIDTPRAWNPPANVFEADGSPRLAAFLTYFAGLFLVLRWWQQADPLRAVRFSIWSTVSTVLIAVLWQVFWPFPQPWGLMVPLTMSIGLQLSSTWVDSRTRGELRKLAEGNS